MEQTTAIGLLERPEVQNTFIKVIQSANRGMSEQEAQLRVQQEVINFQEHCIYNNELANCDPQSVLFGIRKVIGANLSLDRAKGHTYLLPASIKQADGTFKKVLEVSYQAEGMLVLYYNANVIIDHKSPQPKYDEAGKVVSITWEYQLANKRWESVTFNEAHFNKWRKASHTKNGRNKNDADLNKMNYANPNYTSFAGGIDPEFASAKCIKHALKKMALDRNRFEPQPIPVVTPTEGETVDASHEVIDAESGEVIKMYSSNDLNF